MMQALIIQILRSRWFAVSVHAALWLLLYLVIKNAGGKAPDFHEAPAASLFPQNLAPVNKLEPLLSPGQWPKASPGTNDLNPFFTRHFVPPPTPAPPPPPTTRKVEVTYQGFFQTADSPKNAVLKVATNFVIARIGALVETNLYVANASMQDVTLTNTTGQTNVVPLNTKKEIEVPVK